MKPNRTITVLSTIAAVGLWSGAAARADTIKIGIMLPYSGVNADLGDVMEKAIDLYVKEHGTTVGPHKIELIKRDEGPASGAQAKTVATELITRDKVQMIAGVVFSPSAIAMAPLMSQAKIPFLIGNAGTAWITNLSPYIARLSFSMWSTGYPMGLYAAKNLGCKTAAMGYTDFPPGKDSTDAFKAGFEGAGGKIIELGADGQSGPGARLHAVLHAGKKREARLLLRLHSLRPARVRHREDLWRTRHARSRD